MERDTLEKVMSLLTGAFIHHVRHMVVGWKLSPQHRPSTFWHLVTLVQGLWWVGCLKDATWT